MSSIQSEAVCRAWFSADTSDIVGAGYAHLFWEQPNGSGTGSTVLCYLTGRIASPVGAYVITITILDKIQALGI
jgi:hypothetical protein